MSFTELKDKSSKEVVFEIDLSAATLGEKSADLCEDLGEDLGESDLSLESQLAKSLVWVS